jgi:hypothetical protein
MNLTKIFSIVFLAIAIGLGYYLYSRISIKIEEDNRIARVERQVIEKLKMIRDAQIAYQAIHGKYTTDWDQLINFIDTGKIYIIQRRENIMTLTYGRDSVWIETDTLGSVQVKDSLFSQTKYPNFNLQRLPYIPGSNNQRFELFADEIIRGGITVDVIEVRDVAPVNPTRSESHPAFNRKPLRFGSRTEVSTAGNWE